MQDKDGVSIIMRLQQRRLVFEFDLALFLDTQERRRIHRKLYRKGYWYFTASHQFVSFEGKYFLACSSEDFNK